MNTEQSNAVLRTVEARFHQNFHRHEGIAWSDVQARLLANKNKLQSLAHMEDTGGEPDVIGHDSTADEFLICDCSPQSPDKRRNLCYDRKALDARKKNKPQSSVLDTASSMGIELLSEEQYRKLQTLEEFDTKTSSWITTPASIRNLGGALFCDRRYDHVFTYHNGADSYYAARGFRGLLRV